GKSARSLKRSPTEPRKPAASNALANDAAKGGSPLSASSVGALLSIPIGIWVNSISRHRLGSSRTPVWKRLSAPSMAIRVRVLTDGPAEESFIVAAIEDVGCEADRLTRWRS
ncbi:MAG: hypothetical protein HOV79_05715, partial [Hamadaea sp.]|nr:hypothetical protein [Hamadaea sp.]